MLMMMFDDDADQSTHNTTGDIFSKHIKFKTRFRKPFHCNKKYKQVRIFD